MTPSPKRKTEASSKSGAGAVVDAALDRAGVFKNVPPVGVLGPQGRVADDDEVVLGPADGHVDVLPGREERVLHQRIELLVGRAHGGHEDHLLLGALEKNYSFFISMVCSVFNSIYIYVFGISKCFIQE